MPKILLTPPSLPEINPHRVHDILFTPIRLNELETLIQNSVRKVLGETPKTELPDETDRWFNLEGFCNYHPDKPTKPTVYSWVHDGLIPCHKGSGSKRLRFLKSEIDLWLKSGKKKTLAELSVEADQYIQNKKR